MTSRPKRKRAASPERARASGRSRPSSRAKPGRPSTYQPELAAQARTLCQLGATDAELADFFGVAISTISLWKTRHREFSEALKVGKGEVDDRVERTLLQRALGYTFDAVEIHMLAGRTVGRGKNKRYTPPAPLLVPFRKHVPPDVTAIIFWLKNRRKDQWRDVQRHEHDVKHGLSERLERALARAADKPPPAAKKKRGAS